MSKYEAELDRAEAAIATAFGSVGYGKRARFELEQMIKPSQPLTSAEFEPKVFTYEGKSRGWRPYNPAKGNRHDRRKQAARSK